MFNDVFRFDFFQSFINFLTEGQPFLLLTHFIVNQVHVFMCAFLLGLLGHPQNFAKSFADMFHETGAITDESTFNRVNEAASFLVESITAAC